MAKKVLLLANLGSPDSTDTNDVSRYLSEFLMDERVIDIPYLARWLLIKGIVVPLRAPKSAKKYKSIWTENGSPLIHITFELAKKVQAFSGLPVYVCMRYANPSIDAVMKKITAEHPDIEELVMLPLYPHYAMSSYETAVVQARNVYEANHYKFNLKIVKPFYNHPQFISALAASIKPYLNGTYDHVLFSYHGIPERHVRKTDPTRKHCLSSKDCCSLSSEAQQFCYRHQVLKTTELVAKELNLPADKFSYSFQSRLGQDKWLQPFTATQLNEFPGRNIKNLVIVCPAFVSDCLETLEEIRMEGKEGFIKAGGNKFEVVPCLNANDDWVAAVHQLVSEA